MSHTPGQPTDQQLYDYSKWMEEQKRRDAERAHDRAHEMHDLLGQEAVLNGREGIKALIVINGGAIVVMLGFIGAFASKNGIPLKQVTPIATSLMWFSGGIVLGVLSFGFSYITNLAYATSTAKFTRTFVHPYVSDSADSIWWRALGVRFHWAAVLLALSGLACFLTGIWQVKTTLSVLGAP